MARTIKLYKLPAATATPGIRPMEVRDVPAVTQLLNSYLGRYNLTQHFTEEEVSHWYGTAAAVSTQLGGSTCTTYTASCTRSFPAGGGQQCSVVKDAT